MYLSSFLDEQKFFINESEVTFPVHGPPGEKIYIKKYLLNHQLVRWERVRMYDSGMYVLISEKVDFGEVRVCGWENFNDTLRLIGEIVVCSEYFGSCEVWVNEGCDEQQSEKSIVGWFLKQENYLLTEGLTFVEYPLGCTNGQYYIKGTGSQTKSAV